MNESLFLLVICYLALAILLQCILVYCKIAAWIKFSLIILLGGFYFLTYDVLNAISGWPTRQALPAEFVLYAGHVVEPEKTSSFEGDIFVWVAAIENSYPNKRPRAHRLDYDQELHQMIERANRQIKRGVTQMGKVEKIKPGQVADSQDVIKRGDRVRIYDLPQRRLPEK